MTLPNLTRCNGLHMHDKADESVFFEATPDDWRESTLRSAYAGVLNEDALDYELGRFRGLQEVKRRKIQQAAEQYIYERNYQVAARIMVVWALYCQVVFGIFPVLRYLAQWFLWRKAELPPARFGNAEWMRAIYMSLVLVAIPFEVWYLTAPTVVRMWQKHTHIVLMAACGFVVILVSLVFGA
ncbi:hypothetical protein DFH11DRAFT_1595943 [Phellopilus nigrolimitatus]|nr:hypothetical protein DFH11DRAFT_1595943 [Phellopilus nigrolimitatus]